MARGPGAGELPGRIVDVLALQVAVPGGPATAVLGAVVELDAPTAAAGPLGADQDGDTGETGGDSGGGGAGVVAGTARVWVPREALIVLHPDSTALTPGTPR